MNGRINGAAIPLGLAFTILVAVISGAIALGEERERNRYQDRRIGEHAERLKAVETLTIEQALTQQRIEDLKRRQEETNSKLDRVLDALSEKQAR